MTQNNVEFHWLRKHSNKSKRKVKNVQFAPRHTRAQTKETKMMRKNTRFSPLFRFFYFFFSQFACFSSCSLHNVQFSSDRSFCWHFGCAVWFSFHVFHTFIRRARHVCVCLCEASVWCCHWIVCSRSETNAAYLFSFHAPWRIQAKAHKAIAEIHAQIQCRNSQRARQIWGCVRMLFTFHDGIFSYRLFYVPVVGHVFSTIFSGTFAVSCFLFMGYLPLLLFVFVCGFFFSRIEIVHWHSNHMARLTTWGRIGNRRRKKTPDLRFIQMNGIFYMKVNLFDIVNNNRSMLRYTSREMWK